VATREREQVSDDEENNDVDSGSNESDKRG